MKCLTHFVLKVNAVQLYSERAMKVIRRAVVMWVIKHLFQNLSCHVGFVLFVLSTWYWFCTDKVDGLNNHIIMEVTLDTMYIFNSMFCYRLKEFFLSHKVRFVFPCSAAVLPSLEYYPFKTFLHVVVLLPLDTSWHSQNIVIGIVRL